MKREKIKINTERIQFFSDAVIAIIITLMVLEIHLPKIEDSATSSQIFHQLKGVLPNILAFMISFAVLGVYWVNHHQFFKAIEQADWKLLWYNLHFLFWCSLIPLTTALLAEHFIKPAITADIPDASIKVPHFFKFPVPLILNVAPSKANSAPCPASPNINP